LLPSNRWITGSLLIGFKTQPIDNESRGDNVPIDPAAKSPATDSTMDTAEREAQPTNITTLPDSEATSGKLSSTSESTPTQEGDDNSTSVT
jgi:hypothetical protein